MVFTFGSLWVVKARHHDGLGYASTPPAPPSAVHSPAKASSSTVPVRVAAQRRD